MSRSSPVFNAQAIEFHPAIDDLRDGLTRLEINNHDHDHDSLTNFSSSKQANGSADTVQAPQQSVPSPCVWVGNVCPSVSQIEFEAAFSQFGEVKQIRMFPRSRCAFVTFKTADQALASKALENKLMGTMALTLNVGRASRHLWVGNIGPLVDEQVLKTYFERHGLVESVRILRNNNCAFVNMGSEQEALNATQELNGEMVGDFQIEINFQWKDLNKHNGLSAAKLKTKKSKQVLKSKRLQNRMLIEQGIFLDHDVRNHFVPGPNRQLFVGNIHTAVEQHVLWSLFAQFGDIIRIKRFHHRGYAFVVYQNLSDAIWAREQLTAYPPVINDRILDVNFGRTSNIPPESSLAGSFEADEDREPSVVITSTTLSPKSSPKDHAPNAS